MELLISWDQDVLNKLVLDIHAQQNLIILFWWRHRFHPSDEDGYNTWNFSGDVIYKEDLVYDAVWDLALLQQNLEEMTSKKIHFINITYYCKLCGADFQSHIHFLCQAEMWNLVLLSEYNFRGCWGSAVVTNEAHF